MGGRGNHGHHSAGPNILKLFLYYLSINIQKVVAEDFFWPPYRRYHHKQTASYCYWPTRLMSRLDIFRFCKAFDNVAHRWLPLNKPVVFLLYSTLMTSMRIFLQLFDCLLMVVMLGHIIFKPYICSKDHLYNLC